MITDWKFSQCFGSNRVEDNLPQKTSNDQIEKIENTPLAEVTAVEWDDTGKYIAVGDKIGNITLIKKQKQKTKKKKNDSPQREKKNVKNGNAKKVPPKIPRSTQTSTYKCYYQFESHQPEFDYLKSLEIEEKINCVKWLPEINNAQFLLSSNDKTIKLWKVDQKKNTHVTKKSVKSYKERKQQALDNKITEIETITFPTLQTSKKKQFSSKLKHTYGNGHAYHINSISCNSDGENFLSSDDLRINLWNMSLTNEAFTIVDIKPENMDDLVEVITSSVSHPTHCNIFLYTTSKGNIKLGDMRNEALCDKAAKSFSSPEDSKNTSFFSEIIASVSDAKFSQDGRYIISRDYMTVKIWDINQESKPIKSINIHDHLKPKLCDLYENDLMFDKFECTFSNDNMYFASGSYNSYFNIYDNSGSTSKIVENSGSIIEATRSLAVSLKPFRVTLLEFLLLSQESKIVYVPKIPSNWKNTVSRKLSASKLSGKKKKGINTPIDNFDFSKKTMHIKFHPSENMIAIGVSNNLFLYEGIVAPKVTNSKEKN